MRGSSGQDDRYLLFPHDSPRGPLVAAFFHPDATTDDMLHSILHAALLRERLREGRVSLQDPLGSRSLRSAMSETGDRARAEFPAFKDALSEQGWRTDELCFADHGHRVMWNA